MPCMSMHVVWHSNGEEWYRLRSGVQRLMLDLQSVGTFLPLINPVADDFVQRILKIRDPETGIVESLYNEIAKWILECMFVFSLCYMGRHRYAVGVKTNAQLS